MDAFRLAFFIGIFSIFFIVAQCNLIFFERCLSFMDYENSPSSVGQKVIKNYCYDYSIARSNELKVQKLSITQLFIYNLDKTRGTKMFEKAFKHVSMMHEDQTGPLAIHVSIFAFGKEFHLYPDSSYEIKEKYEFGPPNNIIPLKTTKKTKDEFIEFLDDNMIYGDENNEIVNNVPFYGNVGKAIEFLAECDNPKAINSTGNAI